MFDGLFEGMAWVLAGAYDLTHSYGISIILLTLVVMAFVTPLTLRGTRSMMAMQAYQPEIRRIQQEFKGDRQKQNEEMLKFYRENKINPVGSCLPLLIQAPIFIVLFRVISGLTRVGESGNFDPKYLDLNTELYDSLSNHAEMRFIGIDLAQTPLDVLKADFVQSLPFLLIVALVGASSYIQQRQVSGRNPGQMTPQQKQMMRIIPLFSLTVAWFPAALGIYWVTSNAVRVLTQTYISRRMYGIKNGVVPAVVETTAKEKPAAPKPTGTTDPKAKPGRVTPSKKPGAARPPANRPTTGRRTSDPGRTGGSRPRRRPEPPASGDQGKGKR